MLKHFFPKERIYYSFAKLCPERLRENFAQLLIYGGYDFPVELWLGPSIILAILVAIIPLLFPWSFYGAFSYIFLVIALIHFSVVLLLTYIVVYFRAEDRTKRVEDSLPDALQMISSNIRSGMTPFAAIKIAARPEFGPLEEELKKATTKALGTTPFIDSLKFVSKRIRSEALFRSMRLFVSSMKAGGHLAPLLEETARDLREIKSLKDEIVANTKTYQMFILFTVTIGAPLLLSISIHFVEMMESIKGEMITGGLAAQTGFAVSAGISAEFITQVAYVLIVITATLASMMMGVIKEGKVKYGFRYVPFLVTASLVLFVIFRVFIVKMFVT